MNPRTLVNVARYLLVDRFSYTALPWSILSLVFLLNLVIFAGIPVHNAEARYTGGLASIYLFFCVIAGMSVARGLPFGLALGVSRRAYYLGTALLAAALAAVYGLALAILQAIEGASDGWGVAIHFFRVPYILAGPWYLNWLTSFVTLVTLFVYGMWYGIVYRRWNVAGLLTFIAAQIIVVVVAALAISWAHAWASVPSFFTKLTAAGLTGLLAVFALALLAGGLATIRRVTV